MTKGQEGFFIQTHDALNRSMFWSESSGAVTVTSSNYARYRIQAQDRPKKTRFVVSSNNACLTFKPDGTSSFSEQSACQPLTWTKVSPQQWRIADAADKDCSAQLFKKFAGSQGVFEGDDFVIQEGLWDSFVDGCKRSVTAVVDFVADGSAYQRAAQQLYPPIKSKIGGLLD